jgi:uncharacterized membrane protein
MTDQQLKRQLQKIQSDVEAAETLLAQAQAHRNTGNAARDKQRQSVVIAELEAASRDYKNVQAMLVAYTTEEEANMARLRKFQQDAKELHKEAQDEDAKITQSGYLDHAREQQHRARQIMREAHQAKDAREWQTARDRAKSAFEIDADLEHEKKALDFAVEELEKSNGASWIVPLIILLVIVALVFVVGGFLFQQFSVLF